MSKKVYLGADLKKWTALKGYDSKETQYAMGIFANKWYELIKDENKPLDPNLALLLNIYSEHPDTFPIKKFSPHEFFNFLGLKKERKDIELFAKLLGRSYARIYDVIVHNQELGVLQQRYIEACMRMNLSAKETLEYMKYAAGKILDERF